jgi:hypothetical protein
MLHKYYTTPSLKSIRRIAKNREFPRSLCRAADFLLCCDQTPAERLLLNPADEAQNPLSHQHRRQRNSPRMQKTKTAVKMSPFAMRSPTRLHKRMDGTLAMPTLARYRDREIFVFAKMYGRIPLGNPGIRESANAIRASGMFSV